MFAKKNLKKSFKILKSWQVIFVSVIIVLELVTLYGKGFFLQDKLSLNAYADQILSVCREESGYPALCYDKEIPKLMSTITMEEAFEVTRLIQEQDSRYLYCHVLGHNLSYAESEKNPDGWKEVVSRCPTSMCNNGCLHGAMMQRFASEVLTETQIDELKPDLLDVCEPRGAWNPTEGERSMCYHGLGHLYMFITDADIARSLELCEFSAVKPDGRNYVQTCSQGVFMILFQPLEPEDFALIERIAPTNTQERDALCYKYQGLYFESCMNESWALYKNRILQAEGNDLINTDALKDFCSFAKTDMQVKKCYEAGLSMIAVVLLIDHNDQTQYAKNCQELPMTVRSRCFSFGAFRFLQIDPKFADRAVELCNIAGAYRSDCFEELVFQSSHIFHSSSPNMVDYCNKLPSEWQKKCIKSS